MVQHIHKMIQSLHTQITEDDPPEIDDDVPKHPMTYRDSPISCTVVMMVVVDVEYFLVKRQC